MAASDFRTNSQVRSLLAKHWIDLKKIQVGCFRGTVRLTGELCRLGTEGAAPREPQLMDNLELEIRALPDVNRVYLEVTNWLRNASGQWSCTDPGSQARSGGHSNAEAGVALTVETKPGPASSPSSGPSPTRDAK